MALKSEEEERAQREADEVDRALGLEPVQPGPNAFAMAQIQRHRYMLQANAFYQDSWRARENAPSDAPHPAFRQPDLISNLSLPIPRLQPQLHPPQASPTPARQPPPRPPRSPPRESSATTLTPFIMAGRPHESPELNLGTTPENTPRPTQRAFIEERAEQRHHETSGQAGERIPVFHPSPALGSQGFQRSNTTPAANAVPNAAAMSNASANASVITNAAGAAGAASSSKGKERAVTFAPETDRPSGKQSFFNKFLGKKATTERPPTSSPQPEAPMHPKAQQILGPLGRSPSKTKGLFARRTSDATDVKKTKEAGSNPPPRSQTSMGTYGKSSSMNSRTGGSEPGSARQFKGTPNLALARHSSLKYMDAAIPPTPPSKDTPPDEHIIRHLASQKSPIGGFTNDTPSQSHGFVSADAHLSPTREGSYGFRHIPKLHTAPSMYSLHGDIARGSVSVVADANDPQLMSVMDGRLGPLGLEGFSMPLETKRRQESTSAYSPSIYADEWHVGSGHKSIPDIPRRIGEGDETTATPQRRPTDGADHTRSMTMTTQNTTATSGTIDMVYPELSNDPSIAEFQRYDPTPPQAKATKLTPSISTAFMDLENTLEATVPTMAQSAGGSKQEMSTFKTDRPGNKPKVAQDMITQKIRQLSAERSAKLSSPESATNESYIHPALRKQKNAHLSPASATVSPLEHRKGSEHLPQTFYDPEGKTFKKKDEDTSGAKESDGVRKMVKALEDQHETPVPRSKQQKAPNVMDDVPVLNPSVNVYMAGPSMGGVRDGVRRLSELGRRLSLRGRTNEHRSGRSDGDETVAPTAPSASGDQQPSRDSSSEASQTSHANPPELSDAARRSFYEQQLPSPIADINSSLSSNDDDMTMNDNNRRGTQGRQQTSVRSSSASTTAAHEFYTSAAPQTTQAATPTTMTSNVTEASTILEPANYPPGFSPPSGGGPVTSTDIANSQALRALSSETQHTQPSEIRRAPTASSSRTGPTQTNTFGPPRGPPPAAPLPALPTAPTGTLAQEVQTLTGLAHTHVVQSAQDVRRLRAYMQDVYDGMVQLQGDMRQLSSDMEQLRAQMHDEMQQLYDDMQRLHGGNQVLLRAIAQPTAALQPAAAVPQDNEEDGDDETVHNGS